MDVINSLIYKEEIANIAKNLPLKDCTVLVTGATGMIGSSIIDVLICASEKLNNKIKIIALSRDINKLKQRFSYNEEKSMIYFIEQDIVDRLKTKDRIDYIIHTASYADPKKYSLYPVETILTNIYGTNNLLEYCKSHNKTRILLTSTFEVYGKSEKRYLYRESDSGEIDLNQIRSCYPESKRVCEILMRCYYKEYGVDYVIARLCSIYGPTMAADDSKAHAQFIRNGLMGENIILKSEGLQKRTYCYLMDAISAILKVLFTGESGEVYNISYEKSVVTINQVAGTVANICNTKVIHQEPTEDERIGFSTPKDCVLDNGKLRRLGWSGKYSIEEGLSSTINILREIYSI